MLLNPDDKIYWECMQYIYHETETNAKITSE